MSMRDEDIQRLLEATKRRSRQLRTRRRVVVGGVALAIAAAVTVPAAALTGGSDRQSLVVSPGPSSTTITAPTATSTVPPSTATLPSPSTTTPTATTSAPVTVPLTTPATTTATTAPPTTSAPVATGILAYSECTTPTFEPAEITLTCADHGWTLNDLHWSTWTTTKATGVGTFTYNTCTPDCAHGSIQSVPNTQVTLLSPVHDPFGHLVWSEEEQSPEPPGYEMGPYAGQPDPLPTQPQ